MFSNIKSYFRDQKVLFFLLTVIGAAFILFPTHDFQAPLSQGDHGKDLYAFQQTMQGETPYRDYWWVYGPLMPYYYGSIFKVFGVSIQNVLWGEIFLKICASAFFYLALAQFFTPLFAFSCAIWFCSYQPPFNYTYVHTGGLVMLLLITYLFFRYIRRPQSFISDLAFFAAVVLSFIKINFGIISLFVMALFFPFVDALRPGNPAKRFSYAARSFILFFVVLAFHALLLIGLPWYTIKQCIPYLSVYLSGHGLPHADFVSLIFNLSKKIGGAARESWCAIGLSIGFLFSTFQFVIWKDKDQDEKELRKSVLLALGVVSLLAAGTLHEYFLSGSEHRLLWAQPFQLLFVFLILGWMLTKTKGLIRWAVCLVIAGFAFLGSLQFNKAVSLIFRDPLHNLQIGRTDVYLTNPPAWILTVQQTTDYLKNCLGKDETFFALPYDALYYFLTGKKSPVRELQIFKDVYITKEQEIQMISQLEKEKIRYIVLSSRIRSKEAEFGIFGVTHCMLLAQYILDQFEVVQVFGDWSRDPGWYEFHGTKIFKRKK